MTALPVEDTRRRKRRPEPLDRRTGSYVHVYSKPKGGERWEKLSREQGNRRIFALKVYRKGLRKKGQRWGAKGTISSGAVEMFELLVNIAVKNAGRLEPSIDWLAKTLNVPGKVIHTWKAQLKEHGFLDWRKRYVHTGRQGIRGPQVEQTSNAYWLNLPKLALEQIERLTKGARPEPVHEPPSEILAAIEKLNAAAESRARHDKFRVGDT